MRKYKEINSFKKNKELYNGQQIYYLDWLDRCIRNEIDLADFVREAGLGNIAVLHRNHVMRRLVSLTNKDEKVIGTLLTFGRNADDFALRRIVLTEDEVVGVDTVIYMPFEGIGWNNPRYARNFFSDSIRMIPLNRILTAAEKNESLS